MNGWMDGCYEKEFPNLNPVPLTSLWQNIAFPCHKMQHYAQVFGAGEKYKTDRGGAATGS